ncbi:hypothetical protein [Sphingobium boeckii]|uniref:Uncharacterized protein n=1 Tax=Sphingobium boeckii TaxID=1082345 RepID=A0A7W9AEX4_9SPHN|nr:hypothetical protein [Sphingobium boeckii]MBB5684328.1 hypothetical protein [Sphingobium boeckii]
MKQNLDHIPGCECDPCKAALAAMPGAGRCLLVAVAVAIMAIVLMSALFR